MKLRASFSFLNLWAQGRIDEALLGYFHIPRPTPFRFINGRKWDTYSTTFMQTNRCIPPEWGGGSLSDPLVQLKIVTPYNQLCDVVGVFDCYDQGILYELKSGAISARQYANSHQVPLYMLLANLTNLPVKHAIIIRYNDKTKLFDKAILYPSTKLHYKATNFLDTLVPEIYSYFEKHHLFTMSEDQVLSHLKKLA